MAGTTGWEHRFCGSIYVQRRCPTECEFCRSLLVRVRKFGGADGWRKVEATGKKAVRGKVPLVGKTQRERIFRRDGYRCVECGCSERKLLTIDHKVPRSKGGKNNDANLQTMCRGCNGAKGDMTQAEWEKVRAKSAPLAALDQ